MNNLLLLGGGYWGSDGIYLAPLSDHPDYTDFVNARLEEGWNVYEPAGQYDIGDWSTIIQDEYPDFDIVIGHSMGGMLAMILASYQPLSMKKLLLFNVPLIYPSVDGWKECYTRSNLITDHSILVMSKNDPIMTWKEYNGFSMYDALDTVINSYIEKRLKDISGYEHSPFSPVDVITPIWDGVVGDQEE